MLLNGIMEVHLTEICEECSTYKISTTQAKSVGYWRSSWTGESV